LRPVGLEDLPSNLAVSEHFGTVPAQRFLRGHDASQVVGKHGDFANHAWEFLRRHAK
jgi:hypothetical protein